jgi:hypothetical protein
VALRIKDIVAYRLHQPFRDGPYTCSGGRSALGFDSRVVRLVTDQGIEGWGEMAPRGAFYDPTFAGGARAARRELAPSLIGADPRQPASIARRTRLSVKGAMSQRMCTWVWALDLMLRMLTFGSLSSATPWITGSWLMTSAWWPWSASTWGSMSALKTNSVRSGDALGCQYSSFLTKEAPTVAVYFSSLKGRGLDCFYLAQARLADRANHYWNLSRHCQRDWARRA